MIKKTTADSVSKGKNTDTHATYMVNSCLGKVAGVILLLNLLNASICSWIGWDKSS